MENTITLIQALHIWRDRVESTADSDQHISPSDLYDFLIQPEDKKLDKLRLNHLTECPVCLKELNNMIQSVSESEVWDFALPKAATSEHDWPKKISMEGGKYTIFIRRNIHDNNKGLVVLQVEKPFIDALEGNSVEVFDHNQNLIIEGKIINGEVSQEIEDLSGISLKRFFVRPIGK